jgi:hypothetical protein
MSVSQLDSTGQKIYDSIIRTVNSIGVIQKDQFFNIKTKLDEFLTFLQTKNRLPEANNYLTKIQSIINQLIIRYNGKTGGLFGRDDTKLKIRINELFTSLRETITGNNDYNTMTGKNIPVDLNKINMESVITNSKFSGGRRTRRKNRRKTIRKRTCKTRVNRKRRSSHRR